MEIGGLLVLRSDINVKELKQLTMISNEMEMKAMQIRAAVR